MASKEELAKRAASQRALRARKKDQLLEQRKAADARYRERHVAERTAYERSPERVARKREYDRTRRRKNRNAE